MQVALDTWKAFLERLLQELRDRAVAHYGDNLVSLVVFGSVARGTATPESDIDLLIVLREKPPGSYHAHMDYLWNIERVLESLREAKKHGLTFWISPVILQQDQLRVDMSWLWGGRFRVLYDTGFFQDFEKRLREFERRHVRFVPEPIPHYVVIRPSGEDPAG